MRLRYTPLQILLEALALALLCGLLLYIYLQWEQIPARVPLHFNALGEIDRWGNKTSLLILPGVAVFAYLLLTVTAFFPQFWNVPVQVTAVNQAAVHRCLQSMQLLIKAEVMAVLGYLTLQAARATALTAAFLPVMLAVLLGTTLFFSIRLYRLGKITS